MQNRYILKHKDISVAIIEINDDWSIKGAIIYADAESFAHLPVGVLSSKDLVVWLKGRMIPRTRVGLSNYLIEVGMQSTEEYLLRNLGVSVSDAYWLCPYGSDYKWYDINPYTSSFMLDSSATLKGNLPKKCYIDGQGKWCIEKANDSVSSRQSIMEVFASVLHERQGVFLHTSYSFLYDDHCSCPIFTSKDIEFVPAVDVVNLYKKRSDESYYELYIRLCEENGVLDIRNFLEYQIMTDFVISNTDRHFNNFGILRDSNSLEWIGYAPIFDNGNSMFHDVSYRVSDKSLLRVSVNSFLHREVNLFRYVKNRGLVNISLLPTGEELYSYLSKDKGSTESENRKLVTCYKRKIKYLSDFQNGADIWLYKYNG